MKPFSPRSGKGIVRRFAAALAVGLGLASGATAAPPQSVSPEAAPPAWVTYADRVNREVAGWLGGEDEAALRLRAYLDVTRPATDQSSPPLTLRLWIDAGGIIERVEFTPFAHEAANDDLRGLLVARTIGAPPPKGMLLPLRLAVRLDPPPPELEGRDGDLLEHARVSGSGHRRNERNE